MCSCCGARRSPSWRSSPSASRRGPGCRRLLLYLLMGVALGESGLGIGFEDAELAHALGFAALVVILAEGGLTTPWRGHPAVDAARRSRWPRSASACQRGAGRARRRTTCSGCRWEPAVLLGAVTSPTDAAAVFSVLRVVPLPKRLTGALEAESGLNDAPTVVLVTLISTGALADHGVLYNVGLVVYELVAGLAVGLAVGFAGAWVMRRAALPSSGLYPLAVLTLCFLAYGAAAFGHASGFAAVYVAALVLGNAELPHRAATRSFAEGLAWLAQIGLFVMLGLLLSPGRIDLETIGLRRRGRPGAHPGRATALGPGQLDRPADADSRAGLHLVGGAAWRRTDRAGDHPARRGGQRLRAALRHRLRAGRGLHAGHRPDPAGRGQVCYGWRGAPSPAASTSRRPRSSGSPPTCSR